MKRVRPHRVLLLSALRKNTRFAGLGMLKGCEIGGRYQGRILYGSSVLLAPCSTSNPADRVFFLERTFHVPCEGASS